MQGGVHFVYFEGRSTGSGQCQHPEYGVSLLENLSLVLGLCWHQIIQLDKLTEAHVNLPSVVKHSPLQRAKPICLLLEEIQNPSSRHFLTIILACLHVLLFPQKMLGTVEIGRLIIIIINVTTET